ncbi:sensor histidine kinase [Nocardiopsis aegyptia]|uniref:Two-component system sensor histidine kinase DesK n=1 Tax=Nocardiopsis aegyptia TaxID=220378 RepID=A0A7Z0EP37_9ACTN|nr:histidine kinase [Nocardiopsis aegyptia]NYJ35639.1 two-component system sensor histidine kinase DesK [Nocardiopsis aegyptia]
MNEDEAVAGTDPSGRNSRKLRVSRRLVIVSMSLVPLTLLSWPTMDLVLSTGQDWSFWRSAVATVVALPVAVLLIFLIRERIGVDGVTGDASSWKYWVSLALTLLCAALIQSPFSMMFTLGTWWCIGVFVGSRRRSAVVTAVLLVTPWLLTPLVPGDVNVGLYAAVWVGTMVWAVFLAAGFLMTIWLWDLTRDAINGQKARAQLAVSEERLRFARDMHDLLGHSLSALAVKAELAGRLVDRAPERAVAEMAEVQDLARRALQQVRSAVNGYREVDLPTEVGSVREVLRANGTDVTVTGLEGLEVPGDKAGLAAWVVREGGTNVLRHSDASECRIGFSVTRDASMEREALVVEVYNDKVRGPDKEDGLSSGNGLSGLSERVAMGGGALSAARTGDHGFLLRAIIPLAEPASPALRDRLRRNAGSAAAADPRG